MAAAAAAAADLYYHPDDREQEFGCDLDNDDPPPLPDDFIINSEEWADLDKAGRRKIAADRLDAVLKKKAENRRKELARLRQQKFRATGHQNERTLPCPNEGCSRKFGTNAAVAIHSKKCEHFRPTGSASANTNASGAGVGVDAARTPGGGGSVDASAGIGMPAGPGQPHGGGHGGRGNTLVGHGGGVGHGVGGELPGGVGDNGAAPAAAGVVGGVGTAIANGAVAGASSRRSSPRWQQPHATGAAASSARPNTRGSARADDDQQRQYDTVVNTPGVAPLIKMYKDAGVEVPRNWPPGLIFTGKFNVLTWPSYDTVLNWLLNNKPQLNKKVEIKPSPGRGMGLFAAKNLRRNEEVGYYSGILREQRKTHATEYALKFDPEGKEGDDEREIDAEHGGNEMRFANHPFKNEEENMKTKCSKRGSHRVVVFTTTKDVKKGDELLWDYGPDYFEEG